MFWVANMRSRSRARWALWFAPFWLATTATAFASNLFSKMVEVKTTVPTADVWGLSFDNDGALLAVGSALQIDIWDWKKKTIITTLHQPQGALSLGVANPLQFSIDGKYLLACGSRAVGEVFVRVWNTRDWSIAKDLADSESGGCKGMTLSPDGKLLAFAVDPNRPVTKTLVVYEMDSWKMLWATGSERMTTESASFSPDSEIIAINGYSTFISPASAPGSIRGPIVNETKIQLIDVHQQKPQRTILGTALGHIAWNPAGTYLAVVGGGSIDFIDTHAAKILLHVSETTAHMDAKYSPDGKMFVDTDMNGRGTGRGIRIWNFDRSQLLQKIKGNIGTIAFSRDGRFFAAGDSGNTTIWRVGSAL
jgi:WD40 repeat protein